MLFWYEIKNSKEYGIENKLMVTKMERGGDKLGVCD